MQMIGEPGAYVDVLQSCVSTQAHSTIANLPGKRLAWVKKEEMLLFSMNKVYLKNKKMTIDKRGREGGQGSPRCNLG